jgi:hypothetical protein
LRFQVQVQLRLLSIYPRHEEIVKEKIKVAEEVFVNLYNFNPITSFKNGSRRQTEQGPEKPVCGVPPLT